MRAELFTRALLDKKDLIVRPSHVEIGKSFREAEGEFERAAVYIAILLRR